MKTINERKILIILILFFVIASTFSLYKFNNTLNNIKISGNCQGGSGGNSNVNIQAQTITAKDSNIYSSGGSGGSVISCYVEVKDQKTINNNLTLFGSLSIISISITINLISYFVSLIKKKDR